VNKIFVDWSQNDDYKTTVNVYSLRAKDQPTVSTPVTWQEVENCLKKSDPELLVFTSDQVLQRVEKSGDLFEPVLKLKQKLPPLTTLGQDDSQSVAQVPAAPKVKKIQPARPVRKTASKTVAKPVKRKAKVH
jgi:bifunctional non-homologous end joining protein LigD